MHGLPVAVHVSSYAQDAVHGPCVLAEVHRLDQDAPGSPGPLLVTHAGLVAQLARHIGHTVLGRFEQTGGLTTGWVLSPLCEAPHRAACR
ncbi:hypothetical protein ACODT5_28825 [Streptomyces sp. 5.8]|uniref:hypothetical protein n=1 Tax=Streptomyces sp. 5.8 TaxID=3406571 RepID=UPI003BB77D66